jgi:hypothetical protein
MRLAVVAVSALLSGCASVPYGQFDGRAGPQSAFGTRELVVVFIGGQLVVDKRTNPVVWGCNVTQKLEPGHHELYVRLREGCSESQDLWPLELTVEPCTRYSFTAESADGAWKIIPAGKSPIPRCKVPEK